MNKLFTKIAGLTLGFAMAIGVGVAVAGKQDVKAAKAADVYTKIATAESSEVVNGTGYKAYANDDWQITFGGNSASVGTNKSNRGNCKLTNFSKYAVAPVTTSTVASAFVSLTSLSKVSKIDYSFNGGSYQTNTVVYLIYSADNTTFTQVGLKTGTQGADIATGTSYTFDEATGYFGLLFAEKETKSQNWRIDNVVINFYEKEATKTLSSISLSEGEGLKKNYVDGDSVDVEHIVATASYVEGGTSDVTSLCTITANLEKVDLDTTSITYSAIYNGEETIPAIEDLVVDVEVEPLAVSSLSTYGTIKVDFVQNEEFSLGNGKIQINYNNGTYKRVGLDEPGLTVTLGGADITNSKYYMQPSDSGANVVVTYEGKTHQYTIGTVTASEEPGDGYFGKITSVDNLVLGDKYIIVNEENKVALSTTQNSNNRGVSAVSISNNKIVEPAASEVFTLVAGTVTSSTTYGLKTHDNKYIYAASSGNNYLRTETELDDNGSFTIEFDSNGNATITAKGTNTRNVIKCNGGTLFACYSASSTQLPIQLYHFVEEEKPADQVAVEAFVDTYMHLDDVSLNNHEDTNACRDTGDGAKSYYSVAKAAYNDDNILTADQRVLFRTSEIFKIQRAYERLLAWAVANGEAFNETTNKLEANRGSFTFTSDDSIATLIVIISIASISTFGCLLLLKKKRKHQ